MYIGTVSVSERLGVDLGSRRFDGHDLFGIRKNDGIMRTRPVSIS